METKIGKIARCTPLDMVGVILSVDEGCSGEAADVGTPGVGRADGRQVSQPDEMLIKRAGGSPRTLEMR